MLNMVIKQLTIPFFLESDDDKLTRPYSILFEKLSAKLNFSFVSIGTIEYGKLFSDKNGTGLFGSLIRNETQFSLAPQYLTREGVQYLDYTSIINTMDWNIISGPPRIFVKDYFSSLKSFEKSLWEMMFLVLLVYSMVWTIISRFNQGNGSVNFHLFTKEFLNSVYSSGIVLVNQFRDLKRDKLFERLLWISWSIACFYLSVSFTGNLLAKLAKRSDPFRYEDLKDILFDPNMKLLLLENTPPYDDIKTSDVNVKRKIWKKVNEDDTAPDMSDLDYLTSYNEMMAGNLALMMLKRAFFGACVEVCGMVYNVHVSNKVFMSTMFTIYMRRDLPLDVKNYIKSAILQIVESEVLESKLRLGEFLGQLCIITDTTSLSPLVIEKFYFIMIMYAFNVIIAFLVLCIELLTHSSTSQPVIFKTHSRRKHPFRNPLILHEHISISLFYGQITH